MLLARELVPPTRNVAALGGPGSTGPGSTGRASGQGWGLLVFGALALGAMAFSGCASPSDDRSALKPEQARSGGPAGSSPLTDAGVQGAATPVERPVGRPVEQVRSTPRDPGVAEVEREQIPERARAWMDRLTVKAAYDPATGFIVSREVVHLPGVLRRSPALREAVEQGRRDRRDVIVFATADRCAPCQQFKKDALNDPRVVAWLERSAQAEAMGERRAIATHVEVDRDADGVAWLRDAEAPGQGRAIPVTYWIRDGRIVATRPGQIDGSTLLAWIEAQAGA
ncbi:MAG: thioredoxin family protein [Planctomycetota bacterium]|nr:thioredoxin family protein [Planctomycetota bacterium]